MVPITNFPFMRFKVLTALYKSQSATPAAPILCQVTNWNKHAGYNVDINNPILSNTVCNYTHFILGMASPITDLLILGAVIPDPIYSFLPTTFQI